MFGKHAAIDTIDYCVIIFAEPASGVVSLNKVAAKKTHYYIIIIRTVQVSQSKN